MYKTLQEIADIVCGKVIGNSNHIINGLATLENANSEKLSFLFNIKYKKFLQTTKAGAILINQRDLSGYSGNTIIVSDVQYAYAQLAVLFAQKKHYNSYISSTAKIGNNCLIASSVYIGDNVVIGDNVTISDKSVILSGCSISDDCSIGNNCYIHSNVVFYNNSKIGDRVIVHAGAVIGSDGFGNARQNNKWIKIEQLGRVIIGNDVEIGANTTIDRGALDDTIIEDGVKLDNLIHVAHNVIIGANTAIAGCTGIAGSARIGKNCIIAGACSINGHITIADNVVITGMAMITKSIDEPGIYSSGTGFMANEVWRKNAVRFQQLNKIVQRLNKLEKRLDLYDGN